MVGISGRQLLWMDLCILFYPLLVSAEFYLYLYHVIRSNPILFFIIYFIGAIIGGLPSLFYYLYKKIRRKQEQRVTTKRKRKSGYTFIYFTQDYQKRWMSIIIIFGLAFIHITYVTCSIFLQDDFEPQAFSFLILFNSIFITILSRFILKNLLYKHNYLGIGIIIAGEFMLNGAFFHLLLGWDILIGYSFGLSIALSLISVFSKQIMQQKYLHPMTFLIIYGVFGMIIVGITIVILLVFFSNNQFTIDNVYNLSWSFLQFFTDFTGIVMFFGAIILRGFISVLFFAIIFYWSPLDETLLRYSTNIYQVIIYCFEAEPEVMETISIPLLIVGGIITIFGLLIQFELITLHCFGLERYTKKIVSERGKVEVMISEMAENEENVDDFEEENNNVD